jgi:hypothetical protein
MDDCPNQFSSLTRELVIENSQSADYHYNVKISGAEESIITGYSGKRNFITWHAVVLTTENFEEAMKKFSPRYNQLKNLSIRSIHLNGIYEQLVQEKKLAGVILPFDPAGESVKRLKAEVVMKAGRMGWKANMLVYDQDREDDERGEIRE